MDSFLREQYEREETPVGRLSVIFRRIVDRGTELLNERRFGREKLPSPVDLVDFREGAQPYIQKEILMAILEVITSSRMPTPQKLRTQIQDLDRYIDEHPL
jgi:hypothetical protein